MSTHGQIETAQRYKMNLVAGVLDNTFNPTAPSGMPEEPKQVAFILLTARFGDIKDGRVNYISNGERSDMVNMLRELLDRFEGRHPDEGGTKQ